MPRSIKIQKQPTLEQLLREDDGEELEKMVEELDHTPTPEEDDNLCSSCSQPLPENPYLRFRIGRDQRGAVVHGRCYANWFAFAYPGTFPIEGPQPLSESFLNQLGEIMQQQ